MELRGHDHVVEVAIFAPIAAYAAIRELGGLSVRSDRRLQSLNIFLTIACLSTTRLRVHEMRNLVKLWGTSLRPVRGTNRSKSGIRRMGNV